MERAIHLTRAEPARDPRFFLRSGHRVVPGHREVPFSSAHRRALRNLSRRVVLSRLLRAPRLRLCRSAAADCPHHLDRAPSFRRIPRRVAAVARARGRRDGLADRKTNARNGWPRFCPGARRSRGHRRPHFPFVPPLDDDECIRAAHLARMRLVHCPGHQSGRPALLALVRSPYRSSGWKTNTARPFLPWPFSFRCS